jgi:hypothetical protein
VSVARLWTARRARRRPAAPAHGQGTTSQPGWTPGGRRGESLRSGWTMGKKKRGRVGGRGSELGGGTACERRSRVTACGQRVCGVRARSWAPGERASPGKMGPNCSERDQLTGGPGQNEIRNLNSFQRFEIQFTLIQT